MLAHLSDPHLGPLPKVRLTEFNSKRVIGYMNWRGGRGRTFEERSLAALVGDVCTIGPDHIAVTGDLVNLGLDAEFDTALAWLHTLGDPKDVTVVPGNHDAYVARAVAHYSTKWLPFATGDRPDKTMAFPFVRKRGPLAIIGVSTAVATAPLMATGRVDAHQAMELGEALAAAGSDGLCRVVLIHHSPVKDATAWPRRLIGAKYVRQAIARHGAELVLHGHNHKTSVAHIPGPDGPVPVIGAAGLSMKPQGRRKGGAYNLFRIEGRKRPFRIELTVRGFNAAGAVATVAERELG